MMTTNDDARISGSKKRPCHPSRTIDDDDDDDDGDVSGDDPARRRQVLSTSRPLSLLATCALDRGLDIQNHQQLLRSPSDSIGGGDTRLFINQDIHSQRKSIGHAIPPGDDGMPTQNTTSSLPGTNPPVAQMAYMQPDGTLHRGQSHPAAAMLNHQLMFGMTPQELLNYAVLVNILQKSISQGNSTTADLACNCSQALMMPTNHSMLGGAATPSIHQQCEQEPSQLPKQAHRSSIEGRWHASDQSTTRYSESQQLALPNWAPPETSPNNGVLKDNRNNACSVGPPIIPIEYHPQQEQQLNSRQTSAVTHPHVNALNSQMQCMSPSTNGPREDNTDEMSRENFTNGNTHSVDHGYAIARTLAGKVPTPPSQLLQAQHLTPNRRCVLLWTSEDDQRLSTQQCWLRKQIETFPASARDVGARGRNRLLDIGQVGIRCIHCKNLPQEGRGKGSSYFPASIKSIYQSAQNILSFHFKEDTCPLIPRRFLQQMRDAGEASAICPQMAPKAGKSRTGGGKAFWETMAASRTGLVDTTVGIRYRDDAPNYRPLKSIELGASAGEMDENDATISCFPESSVLTHIEDKGKVTDFCFILMSQFVPYCSQVSMSTSDMMEWDSDLENEEPLHSVGIVCRFCGGVSDDGKRSRGIFLSSKADTMMRNKNLARIYNHLLVCCCPDDVKTKLKQAKNVHLPQSDRLRKGWKKQFFESVCERLMQALYGEEGSE